MKEALSEGLKNPVVVIELLTWVGAAILWFATMSSVPEDITALTIRVANAEERVRMVEQNLEKNNTKTDLILKAVYDIREDMKNIYKR
jgi:hypothetical protein